MIDQIKQVPNYQSLSHEEIRTYLDETIEVVNMRGWTPEDMRKEGGLTFEEAMTVMETLRQGQGLFASAFQWLSTSKEGLEFGSDEKQGLIDYASAMANWETSHPGLTAKMKALGRSTMKRFQQLGLPELPTVEQIEDALNPDFDAESKEVLFTLNRQANGQTLAVMRTTPVKLRNGIVVDRGESQNIFSGELLDQIKQLIEQSL